MNLVKPFVISALMVLDIQPSMSARSTNGAPSDLFEVSIVIVEEVVIDADGDGYPSGLDCDDGNPVRPGAPEICGDGIDQDCHADVPEAACDLDGDGFCPEGDCDDTNRRVFPGAFERCNGRDDNRAGGVDEGYEIGAECAVGVGACRNAAILRCSADGLGKVCGAVPGLPEEEICDGIDNDCNKQWMMFRWPVPQTLITVVAVTFNVYLKPIKYQPAGKLRVGLDVSLIVRLGLLTSIEKRPMVANMPASLPMVGKRSVMASIMIAMVK